LLFHEPGPVALDGSLIQKKYVARQLLTFPAIGLYGLIQNLLGGFFPRGVIVENQICYVGYHKGALLFFVMAGCTPQLNGKNII
jgi:hypothetical protein